MAIDAFSRYVIEMASARLCRMWWNAQTGNIPISMYHTVLSIHSASQPTTTLCIRITTSIYILLATGVP